MESGNHRDDDDDEGMRILRLHVLLLYRCCLITDVMFPPLPLPIISVSTTRESATEQSTTDVMFPPLPPPITSVSTTRESATEQSATDVMFPHAEESVTEPLTDTDGTSTIVTLSTIDRHKKIREEADKQYRRNAERM